MAEPENILKKLVLFIGGTVADTGKPGALKGKKILVTAGPTYEAIDPVRFIGNHSSGKMGYSIALELAGRGAEVILVSGPVSIDVQHTGINIVRVDSASDMYTECIRWFPESDGCIMTAAVADYTPVIRQDQKIKRGGDSLILEMKPTTDILGELGKVKREGQILAGFALETENEKANAAKKLHNKNLDFIVLNSLRDEGAGFHGDTNKISIISPDGSAIDYAKKTKSEVAIDIVDYMSGLFRCC